MAYDPSDSGGEYRRPLPQFLDNLVVTHPELGQTELWKAIAWETSKLRNYMHRADSAAAISEAGQKGAPSNQPKLAPPLVADAASKDEASKMKRIDQVLNDLEKRLDTLEERKRRMDEEAECARRAEAALALAEQIAESAPSTMLDALSPAPNQRLN